MNTSFGPLHTAGFPGDDQVPDTYRSNVVPGFPDAPENVYNSPLSDTAIPDNDAAPLGAAICCQLDPPSEDTITDGAVLAFTSNAVHDPDGLVATSCATPDDEPETTGDGPDASALGTGLATPAATPDATNAAESTTRTARTPTPRSLT